MDDYDTLISYGIERGMEKVAKRKKRFKFKLPRTLASRRRMTIQSLHNLADGMKAARLSRLSARTNMAAKIVSFSGD